jgi:predicted nucleic acid-binding protein
MVDLGGSFKTQPVVMDTNVLVAAACRRENSLAHRIVMGVLLEEIPLILTEAISLEYLEVLQRPRILELTRLNHSQSADLVTELIALSHRVQTRFSWRPNLRDESDNKFVDAAVCASAIVVTYNVRHFDSADLPRHGWALMRPREFVARYLEEA